MKRRNAIDDTHDAKSTTLVAADDAHVDVESQSQPSPSAQPSPRSANDRGENGHSGAHNVGSTTAILLMRKLMMNFTTNTATTSSSSPRSSHYSNYLQTLIKDILLGTLLGVIFLLSLFFLDYHHILNMGSAKSFQNAALAYVTHPDTIQSLETNFDVKIVPLVMYTSIVDEITKNNQKIANNTSLTQVEEDLAVHMKELESLKVIHDERVAKVSELLNLDNWCGSCKGPWGRCRDRVDYLMDKYRQNEWKSQSDLMTEGHCRNDQN